MLQILIDALGKLGPALIALLVLLTNRAQNRWINLTALRSAQVEDQKFRLALLDRRNAVLEKLLRASETVWSEGTISEAGLEAANEAMRIAELVFNEEEHVAIAQLLRLSRRWHLLSHRAKRFADSSRPSDRVKYESAANEMSVLEGEMIRRFEPLMAMLKAATRVQSVSPLEPFVPLLRINVLRSRR